MSPLAAGINDQMITKIGEKGGKKKLNGEVEVLYLGDNVGRAIVLVDGNRVGDALLPRVGDKAEIEAKVWVPPVEKGELPTEVSRKVNLERCL